MKKTAVFVNCPDIFLLMRLKITNIKGNMTDIVEESQLTFMELSCPECDEMIVMQMKLDASSSLLENVGHAAREMIGVSQHYSFLGIQQCLCGKMVISSLTVYSYKMT